MTPKTFRSIALVAGIVSLSVLTIQCSGQNSGGPWTTSDSWFNPPETPAAMKSEDMIREDEKRYQVPFREVAASKELQAEQALKTKSYLRLDFAQARLLTNGSYRKAKNAPYLVRAVYLNRATGGFHANYVRGNLFVHHGSLGAYRVPMKRQALIVNLPKAPKNVYVDCSMAR